MAKGEVYTPAKVIREADVYKLTVSSDGSQKWDLRWVVLTPTHLLIFKGAGKPAVGAKAKTSLYLGAGSAVEVVNEGEIENWNEFSFSIIPGDDSSETVLCTNDAKSFHMWKSSLERQCLLSTFATNHGLAVDIKGNFLNVYGAVVSTADEVLRKIQESRPDVPSYDADDDIGEQSVEVLSEEASVEKVNAVIEDTSKPLSEPSTSVKMETLLETSVPDVSPEKKSDTLIPDVAADSSNEVYEDTVAKYNPGASTPQNKAGSGSAFNNIEADNTPVRQSARDVGLKTAVDHPNRPNNREVPLSMLQGESLSARKPTGSRIRGGNSSNDIPDAPPQPPERGASAHPLGSSINEPLQNVVNFSVSSNDLHGTPHNDPPSRTRTPASMQTPRGQGIPEPKFKAWASTGGVPQAATSGLEARHARKPDDSQRSFSGATPVRTHIPHDRPEETDEVDDNASVAGVPSSGTNIQFSSEGGTDSSGGLKSDVLKSDGLSFNTNAPEYSYPSRSGSNIQTPPPSNSTNTGEYSARRILPRNFGKDPNVASPSPQKGVGLPNSAYASGGGGGSSSSATHTHRVEGASPGAVPRSTTPVDDSGAKKTSQHILSGILSNLNRTGRRASLSGDTTASGAAASLDTKQPDSSRTSQLMQLSGRRLSLNLAPPAPFFSDNLDEINRTITAAAEASERAAADLAALVDDVRVLADADDDANTVAERDRPDYFGEPPRQEDFQNEFDDSQSVHTQSSLLRMGTTGFSNSMNDPHSSRANSISGSTVVSLGDVDPRISLADLPSIPLRDVRKAFDAASAGAGTPGSLPLAALPALAASLHYPVLPDFYERSCPVGVHLLDPFSVGAVERPAFEGWWSAHVIETVRRARARRAVEIDSYMKQNAAASGPSGNMLPVGVRNDIRSGALSTPSAASKIVRDRSASQGSPLEDDLRDWKVDERSPGPLNSAVAAPVPRVFSPPKPSASSSGPTNWLEKYSSIAQRNVNFTNVAADLQSSLGSPLESSSYPLLSTSLSLISADASFAHITKSPVENGPRTTLPLPVPFGALAPPRSLLISSLESKSNMENAEVTPIGLLASPSSLAALPLRTAESAHISGLNGTVSEQENSSNAELEYSDVMNSASAAVSSAALELLQDVQHFANPNSNAAIGSEDLFALHRRVKECGVPDAELNGLWQQLLELPEWDSLSAHVKSVVIASFQAKFALLAKEGARTIVGELLLPENRKKLPRVSFDRLMNAGSLEPATQRERELDRNSTDAVYYYHGILLRVAQGSLDLASIDKLSGTELNNNFLTQLQSVVTNFPEDETVPQLPPIPYPQNASPATMLLNPAEFEHKLAGNTMRAIRSISEASLGVLRDWKATNRLQTSDEFDGQANPSESLQKSLSSVLTSLIDIAGVRVFAIALPPFENNSIVYGYAEDGSNKFVQSSPNFNNIMRRIARTLRLKVHSIQSMDGSGSETLRKTSVIPSNSCIQGHLGLDGRLYATNLTHALPVDISSWLVSASKVLQASQSGSTDAVPSSIYPPLLSAAQQLVVIAGTAPVRTPPTHPIHLLTHQLRPEFVKSYALTGSTPVSSSPLSEAAILSPDTFLTETAMNTLTYPTILPSPTNIGEPVDRASNDTAAAAAALHLLTETVPTLIQSIEDDVYGYCPSGEDLRDRMHAAGVNARYLGYLYSLSSLPHVKETFAVEMIARTSKIFLRHRLRFVLKHLLVLFERISIMERHNQLPASLNDASRRAIVERLLTQTTLDTLNFILGLSASRSEKSSANSTLSLQHLSQTVLPLVHLKFGVEAPASVHQGRLFSALQYHWSLSLRSDFPLLPHGLLTLADDPLGAVTAHVASLPSNSGCVSGVSGQLRAELGPLYGDLTLPSHDFFVTVASDSALSSVFKGCLDLHPLAVQPAPPSAGSGGLIFGVPFSRSSNYGFLDGNGNSPITLQQLSSFPVDASVAQPFPAAPETAYFSTLNLSILNDLSEIPGLAFHQLGQITNARQSSSSTSSLGQQPPSPSLLLQERDMLSARLAIQQSLSDLSPRHDSTTIPLTLLRLSKVLLRLNAPRAALITTLAGLSRVQGTSVIAAQLLEVRAWCFFLLEDPRAALGTISMASRALCLAAGPQSILHTRMGTDLGLWLSRSGRFLAAAQISLSSANFAAKILGNSHLSMPSLLGFAAGMARLTSTQLRKFIQLNQASIASAGSASGKQAVQLSVEKRQKIAVSWRSISLFYEQQASSLLERVLILLEGFRASYGQLINQTPLSFSTVDLEDKYMVRLVVETATASCALADSLLLQGLTSEALLAAGNALSLRKQLMPPHFLSSGFDFDRFLPPTLPQGSLDQCQITPALTALAQSLLQVAAVAERLDRPLDALGALEPFTGLLNALRASLLSKAQATLDDGGFGESDEEILAGLNKSLPVHRTISLLSGNLLRFARHTVRLTLYALPVAHRTLLIRIIKESALFAQTTHAVSAVHAAGQSKAHFAENANRASLVEVIEALQKLMLDEGSAFSVAKRIATTSLAAFSSGDLKTLFTNAPLSSISGGPMVNGGTVCSLADQLCALFEFAKVVDDENSGLVVVGGIAYMACDPMDWSEFVDSHGKIFVNPKLKQILSSDDALPVLENVLNHPVSFEALFGPTF